MGSNPFVGLTYGQALDLIVARFGDRDALVFEGRRWTFAEALVEIDLASARLSSLGLKRQDKVALLSPNRPEYLWYWLAGARAGLVMVLLNTRLTRTELGWQLAQSDSRALLVSGAGGGHDLIQEIVELCPELTTSPPGSLHSAALPELRHVISLSDPVPGQVGIWNWSDPHGQSSRRAESEADATQPAMIVYSSGTTALPKGVMLTHCVWQKAFEHGERFRQTEDDRLYLAVPLFGIMGNVNGVLTSWTRGSAVILQDRFDAESGLRLIQDERCTFAYLFPVMLEKLMAHPRRSQFDISSLRTGTVVTNDPEVMKRAIVEFGMSELYSTYGMSETASVVFRTYGSDPLDVRLGTHGKPLPDIEARIADPETDAPLGDDVIGEIQVKAYCVTPGYYRNPEATRLALTADGWFKTGDSGLRRADGNFCFIARLKDSYKHNGFNVATAEVEAALQRHPDVAGAAVVSVPDARSGAVGIAFVVPRRGSELTEAPLLDFLKPTLASYKWPRRIIPIAELPLTAGTGKVQKARLVEIANEILGPSQQQLAEDARPGKPSGPGGSGVH